MLPSPRIRLKPLAQLCHRLAISTKAGIQDRKIWSTEAERGSNTQRSVIMHISQQLENRKTLTDALAASGNYFPPLFRHMVAVGELSGQLDQTYERLAEHYDQSLKTKREFLGQLTWPLFQLGMALFVIGLLIWIMGILPANQGNQVDMLGIGLTGNSGLFIYINALVLATIAILLFLEASRRGLGWSRKLQHTVMRLPMIGRALKTLAIARFTWALRLVLDTPMDLRQALPLAFETTGNDYFACHGQAVANRIEQGQTIHAALAETALFPTDFLDSIAVGEQSGRIVETMEHVAAEYRVKAQSATSLLAQAAGYLIWLLIATFIIAMIFHFASFYFSQLKQTP